MKRQTTARGQRELTEFTLRSPDTVFGDSITPSLLALLPDETVTILVENTYACGRESSTTVTLPAPAELTDDWWQENVHQHSGDGHPCGAREHAMYEATITASTRPELVGTTHLLGEG